jgi:hypothetical protein
MSLLEKLRKNRNMYAVITVFVLSEVVLTPLLDITKHCPLFGLIHYDITY